MLHSGLWSHRGIPCDGQERGDRLRRTCPPAGHGQQVGRIDQCLDQKHAGRAAILGGQRNRPQALAEPPFRERVGTAQRRMQQRHRSRLVQCGLIERTPQQQQDRRHRRLLLQRQVLGLGRRRHTRLLQRPLQRCQLQQR